MKVFFKWGEAPAGRYVQVWLDRRIFNDDPIHDLIEQVDGVSLLASRPYDASRYARSSAPTICVGMVTYAMQCADIEANLLRALQSTMEVEIEIGNGYD